jgi:hypothetical protein
LTAAAAFEIVPAAQSMHIPDPSVALYLPATHAKQTSFIPDQPAAHSNMVAYTSISLSTITNPGLIMQKNRPVALALHDCRKSLIPLPTTPHMFLTPVEQACAVCPSIVSLMDISASATTSHH